MRRALHDRTQFTPFGIWIWENCKSEMTVSNLDYILYDYRANPKKILLLEEKQSNGKLGTGQLNLFILLDKLLRRSAAHECVDYWGFYLLVFPEEKTMPGLGMKLNGVQITVEELALHLNFEKKFCEGWWRPNCSR